MLDSVMTPKNMLHHLNQLLFIIFSVSEVNCAFSKLDSCSLADDIKLDICVIGNQSYIPPLPTGKSLSEALLFAEHGENMLCTKIVLNVRNNFCTQHVLPRLR